MKKAPGDDGKEVPRDWTPQCEGDHFRYCATCRQWFDVRDPDVVMHHDTAGHVKEAAPR